MQLDLTYILIIGGLGLFTSFSAIIFAAKRKGSMVGRAFNSFGMGILSNVLAFVFLNGVWMEAQTQEIVATAFLVISYLFICLGILRMRNLLL